MVINHEEIAASVGAHQDLGPGYDQAVAEGLVERIGTEIEQRIAQEVDGRVAAEITSLVATELDRYGGCRHVRRGARRAARRANRSGRPSNVLALGSMLFAVVATLTVLLTGRSEGGPNGNSAAGAGAIMLTAVIWIVIGAINVAYARRQE
jgi:hypothetical protein